MRITKSCINKKYSVFKNRKFVPSHLNNNNVLDAIASCYIDLDLFTELNYEDKSDVIESNSQQIFLSLSLECLSEIFSRLSDFLLTSLSLKSKFE